MAGEKRNAEATRAAILEAARAAFTRHGFDGVGLREIASAAGANVALVNRYFGSKQGLFEEAVTTAITMSSLFPVSREEFCDRLIQQPLHNWPPERVEFDPTRAMLRSSGNELAEQLIRQGINTQLIEPLAEWFGGEDGQTRAGLTVALIAGIAVLRDVLALPALNEDGDRVEQLLKTLFQQIVEDSSAPSPAE